MGSVAGRKLSVFCMENCLEKCKFWSWPFGQLFPIFTNLHFYRILFKVVLAIRTNVFA